MVAIMHNHYLIGDAAELRAALVAGLVSEDYLTVGDVHVDGPISGAVVAPFKVCQSCSGSTAPTCKANKQCLAEKEFAVDDEGHQGEWKTVNGRHIFIRDGEDLDSALTRSLGHPSAVGKGLLREIPVYNDAFGG